jgi:hypothetical protein
MRFCFSEMYKTMAMFFSFGGGGVGGVNEREEKRRLNPCEWNVFAKSARPFAAARPLLFHASQQNELPRQSVS